MSIDELQAAMAKAEHKSGISPIEALLGSKSLMFLSGEIASLKDALCLESKKIQTSNDKLARSQNLYSIIISALTLALVVVGLLQYGVMKTQTELMKQQTKIMNADFIHRSSNGAVESVY